MPGKRKRTKAAEAETQPSDSGPSEPQEPIASEPEQPTKFKKGAKRTIKTKVLEKPGTITDPSSYIKIEKNEQKLAAYVGFNNIAQLRQFMLSWPVVKGFLRFQPIAQNLNKKTPFRLIADSESDMRNADPTARWPLGGSPDSFIERQKKARHIAAYLLDMEEDIRNYGTTTDSENQKQNIIYLARLSKQYPTLPVPAEPLASPVPTLGPYQSENRLEPLNRCWNLLQYLRFVQHAAGVWDLRLGTLASVRQSVLVNESHIPAWMNPPARESTARNLTKTTEVTTADALPPIQIRIFWDRDRKFPGKEDLLEALERAEEKGETVPNDSQIITQDPRLCQTAASFKDAIRRAYNCQRLGVDIYSLRLTYSSQALQQTMAKDLLRDPWRDSKSMHFCGPREFRLPNQVGIRSGG